MQQAELITTELPYAVNEELKYLRANIQFSGSDKKVIMLTSSISGEGKSSLTLNLARSMAELGKRVLLLDTDLRRSMLKHEIANRSEIRVSLTHYLSGLARIEDALIVTEKPSIYMMIAGPVPPNPAELLAHKRMDILLEWARNNFDYIFIDTAPLGTVIDAAALAPKCDGSVIVVESGKIPYKVVQNVSQQLKDAQCPVLGVVLNKVDTSHGRKYYNRYYKNYSYEYKKDSKKDSKK